MNYFKKITFKNIYKKIQVEVEKIRGLDFSSVILPENVGLNPFLVHNSSPSGNKYLMGILSDLEITNKDRILDIGCGKGSAINTMLKFPFEKVDGCEISDSIAKIAKQNFRKLNSNRTVIINCDAINFNSYDNYNMYYFYNPFPSVIMQKVIKKINLSISNSNERKFIIYNNPTCHNIISQESDFVKVGQYPDEWGNLIYLYSNKVIGLKVSDR